MYGNTNIARTVPQLGYKERVEDKGQKGPTLTHLFATRHTTKRD